MQEDRRPRARAVVRVEPEHAACYWQAISEVLGRSSSQDAHVEINVLERSNDASGEAPHLVELEMCSADLDQAALDDAVSRARLSCTHQPIARGPSARVTAIESLGTLFLPLGAGPGATVRAPLTPQFEATIHAPLFGGQQLEPLAPVPILEPPVTAEPARKSHLAEAIRVVATLVAVVIGLRTVIQTFGVDGPSMQPTFETDQRLLVNRAAFWHVDGTPFDGLVPASKQGSVAYVFGGPRRGDVVVFRPPGDSGFESDLIKRVVGLPGEAVSIQAGKLYVNGELVPEPYVQFQATYTYPGPDLAVLVPSDGYFVLGDNRPVSSDSHLGWFVAADKLVGLAWLSYWPVGRLEQIPRGEPSSGN